MPNFASNTLRLIGEHDLLQAVTEKVKGKPPYAFDFNKIIPMPKELEGTFSPMEIEHALAFYCLREKIQLPEVKGLFLLRDKNIRELARLFPEESAEETFKAGKRWYELWKRFGYVSWYTWACDNWGTKWNALDSDGPIWESDNAVMYTFDTAWSAPLPVITKLSYQNPDITFELEVIYEGGEPADRFIIERGNMTDRQEGKRIFTDAKSGKVYEDYCDIPEDADIDESYEWEDSSTFDLSNYLHGMEGETHGAAY